MKYRLFVRVLAWHEDEIIVTGLKVKSFVVVNFRALD